LQVAWLAIVLCLTRFAGAETRVTSLVPGAAPTDTIWVQILVFPCDHAAMGSDWGTAS
jgi:hypothetical protein